MLHCWGGDRALKKTSITCDVDGNAKKRKRLKEVMVLGQIQMPGEKIIF